MKTTTPTLILTGLLLANALIQAHAEETVTAPGRSSLRANTSCYFMHGLNQTELSGQLCVCYDY